MILKTRNRLGKPFVSEVLKLKDVVPPERAVTYTSNAGQELRDDASFRRTEIRWLLYGQFARIHQELIRAVSEYQMQFGVRDPLRIERGVQLATYRPGDHYGWHVDGRPGDRTRRVLSISVLLNDEFKGGRLEFRTPGAPVLKKPGDIVIFNSDEWHRVTPVTAGTRDSLVVWFGIS